MSARFFARGDESVANGSYLLLRSMSALKVWVATYMNGDYMGSEDVVIIARSERADRIAATVAGFAASGLVEYAAKDFKRLAPKCCGGRGRA